MCKGDCDNQGHTMSLIQAALSNLRKEITSPHGTTTGALRDLEAIAIYMNDRIEKMEKALSEEMAKTREMDDILAGVVKKVGYVSEAPEGGGGAAPFVSPASTSAAPPIVDRELKFTTAGPCHTICIMPNGSPSDIPFSVALEYLKAGRKLTHPSFGEGNSIEASAQNSILMHWPDEGKWTNFVMDSALALSDAWTVLPEKPQNP